MLGTCLCPALCCDHVHSHRHRHTEPDRQGVGELALDLLVPQEQQERDWNRAVSGRTTQVAIVIRAFSEEGERQLWCRKVDWNVCEKRLELFLI